MKITSFAVLVLLSTLALAGCGDQKAASRSDNPASPNESSKAQSSAADQAQADKADAGQATDKAEEPKSDAQPVQVESTLPFKDLDPATAAKGVDPGRIVIDASGVDSNGQPLSLADYRGKVILLDTWASW